MARDHAAQVVRARAEIVRIEKAMDDNLAARRRRGERGPFERDATFHALARQMGVAERELSKAQRAQARGSRWAG